jgi:hypothetical protein
VKDVPGELSMLDHTGACVPLKCVEVSEARCSLGLMIAGDCNWDAEVARLLQASIDWRANLRAGHLSTSDAWYALNHTINRTVEYPMMATYLTKAQCEKIMRPFPNAGLSASGVVHFIPHCRMGPVPISRPRHPTPFYDPRCWTSSCYLAPCYPTYSDRTASMYDDGRAPTGNGASTTFLCILLPSVWSDCHTLLDCCDLAVSFGLRHHFDRSLSQASAGLLK